MLRRFALAALLGLAPAALAGTTRTDTVYTTVTAEETAAMLKRRGIAVTSKVTSSGHPVHVFDLDGIKTSMYHYNCSAEGECTAVQLYIGLAMTEKPSPQVINTWNQRKRLTVAYLDADSDPCLEADLDLAGGVSMAAIEELVRMFQFSTNQFVEHVGFRR